MKHLNAAKALMRSFSSNDDEGSQSAEHLQARLERQNLILQTLLVLLLEKGVITEGEFREWVKKVDQLDGVRDGRLGEDKTMVKCPECGIPIKKKIAQCPHCGAEVEPDLLPRVP